MLLDEGTDGSNEPKKIGPEHKACLESQIKFFQSFRDKVDLLITFGKAEKLFRKTNSYFSFFQKCKEHISLPHPAGAWGWNEIDAILNSSNQNELENKIKHISYPGYRTQVINCFIAYQRIKIFVKNQYS